MVSEPEFELDIDALATGGEGVGRDETGRVVFVAGALPGERVVAVPRRAKKRWARADLRTVVRASPERVEPACAHRHAGCGGCDLAHLDASAALELKRRIIADVLVRIARIGTEARPGVDVIAGGSVPPTAYRTTVRAAVRGDRAGFRHARSHEVVIADRCLVAHRAIADILERGRFPGADEVTVRVGDDLRCTVILAPTTNARVVVPDGPDAAVGDVTVVGADALAAGDPAAQPTVTITAAGRAWRVSAGSFFQSGPAAADLLVGTVRDLLAPGGAPHRLVDLYAGVGLFAGSIRVQDSLVTVESSPSAVADARVNLTTVDGSRAAGTPAVEIVASQVERWTPVPADVVIADPSRAGLDRAGVAAVAGTGAARVVLVSCDPGSFGRDSALLAEAGYRLDQVRVLDLFPQTSHVEAVALFTSSASCDA